MEIINKLTATATVPILAGNITPVQSLTAVTVSGSDLQHASLDSGTAVGDLIHILSGTGVTVGYYRITVVGVNQVTVDRAPGGAGTNIILNVYKDVLIIQATDATNGQFIGNFSAQNKPLQIGGHTYVSTTDLTSEDIVIGGEIKFVANAYIGDSANAKSTLGLTINQSTNDDEIISLKSSDVGHTVTDDTETDTYGLIKKYSATAGGLLIRGLTDSDAAGALVLEGIIGATDPTDTNSPIILIGSKQSANTTAALGAAETVFQLKNRTTNLITVLGSGNLGFNTTSFGTSLAAGISFGQWTAPTTSPADVAQLGAADMQSAPGMTRLHQRTEAGITSPLALHDEVNAMSNPRRPSQAVSMLAAAAGSTGITTADNANLDFGTGNFSLAFKASLPDWTPATTVVLAQKTDGTNGWNLQVLTTGIIRLTINVTNYDSTVAPVITDGMVGKIGVSVTRETAGVAGSVVFYFNGTQLGASVAIGAGAPTTVNNAAALYVLGTSSTRTAGQVHFFAPYNRVLTATEQLLLFRNGIDFADKWGSQTPKYTSDFSAGANGWTADTGAGSVTGNIDGIGGQDDTLRFTIDGGNTTHRMAAPTIGVLGVGTGKYASITYSYYIPSSNSNVDGIRLGMGGSTIDTSEQTTLDAWTSVTTPIFLMGSSGLLIYAKDGVAETFQDAGSDDVFYIKGFTITPYGAVAAYEPEGIQVDGWKDSSTNGLNLSYPSAGSSLVRLTPLNTEILLSVTTVSFAANADTTIYTVPTGRRAVLTKAIAIAGADAGATTTISIGANGSETDWIPANTLSNLDAANDSVILMPVPNTTPLKIKSYAAGTVIQAQVANQSGGATNTLYLFGILY